MQGIVSKLTLIEFHLIDR